MFDLVIMLGCGLFLGVVVGVRAARVVHQGRFMLFMERLHREDPSTYAAFTKAVRRMQ